MYSVPSKSDKQKTRTKFIIYFLSVPWKSRKDQDPELLVRGTDLRIRIRSKVSRTMVASRDGAESSVVDPRVRMDVTEKAWRDLTTEDTN
jgi:hypothetical protein